MSRTLWLRLLGYLALLLVGGAAAFLFGLRLLGNPHLGLVALGVWLVALVFLASWRELRPWAQARGVARPETFALAVAGLSALLWGIYVLTVSLPLAFLTDITGTPGGRRVLGVITFVPLLVWLGVGFWLSWLLLGPRTPRRPAPRVQWRE